jgi:hypothetical protein
MKSQLEQALEAAAKSNPDLRVALAKLAEAEANVARTRLQVIQKVVAAYQEVDKARQAVKEMEGRIKDALERSARGQTNPRVTYMRDHQLPPLKAKLADAEAELDYLLGKPAAKANLSRGHTGYPYGAPQASLFDYIAATSATGDAQRALGLAQLGYSVAGPTADRLRKALDRKVSVKFQDVPARVALDELRKLADGLHIQAPTKGEVWNEKVTASLTDVPFGAALQLLEDVLTGHRIIVREYGLFIVPQEKVPPGATPLGDFWRDAVKPDKPAAAPPRRN